MSDIEILKEKGSKMKARLHDDGYGLEFLTMRNGWQWNGAPVDDDLLGLMKEVIDEYFDMKNC